MGYIIWDATMGVGNSEVDAQHQRLFAQYNEMYDAVKAGRSKESLDRQMLDFVESARQIFAEEERIIEAHGCDELSAHRQEHREFLERTAEFERQFASGPGRPVSEEMMRFISKWLVGHVRERDQQCAPRIADCCDLLSYSHSQQTY